jgi:hypothetical protein
MLQPHDTAAATWSAAVGEHLERMKTCISFFFSRRLLIRVSWTCCHRPSYTAAAMCMRYPQKAMHLLSSASDMFGAVSISADSVVVEVVVVEVVIQHYNRQCSLVLLLARLVGRPAAGQQHSLADRGGGRWPEKRSHVASYCLKRFRQRSLTGRDCYHLF